MKGAGETRTDIVMDRKLERCRTAIDRIDRRFTRLLKKRFALVKRVGRLKNERGIAVVQPEREERILARVSGAVSDEKARDYLISVYRALFKASYRVEGEDV
jgi:monofunctional chorismate mutase